jgi:general secretion pathway protein J
LNRVNLERSPVKESVAKPPAGNRGFTLVEVVVALSILSLLMLAVISALRTFGNTQASLEKLTDRVDQMRTVSGFLRDTLQSAVVGTRASSLSLGGIPPESSYFNGDSSSLEWKAPILFGEGYGGTFLVRVGREQDRLVLRWQEPTRDDEDIEWDDTPSRDLLQGVEEFSVSYRAEFGEPWQKQWHEQNSPALVRMGIKAAGRYWPDLILQVQR